MNEPLASASGEAICVPRGKDGNGKAFAAGRRGGCIHLDKPGIRNVYTAPALLRAGRNRPPKSGPPFAFEKQPFTGRFQRLLSSHINVFLDLEI